jgi:60 kDa SS-A/Ro ribonucleoprotein
VNRIVSRLSDSAALHASRIHPLTILLAASTFKGGRGVKGSLTWDASPEICNALDAAFVAAFKNVEATGKRFCIAMDVSGE